MDEALLCEDSKDWLHKGFHNYVAVGVPVPGESLSGESSALPKQPHRRSPASASAGGAGRAQNSKQPARPAARPVAASAGASRRRAGASGGRSDHSEPEAESSAGESESSTDDSDAGGTEEEEEEDDEEEEEMVAVAGGVEAEMVAVAGGVEAEMEEEEEEQDVGLGGTYHGKWLPAGYRLLEYNPNLLVVGTCIMMGMHQIVMTNSNDQ